MLDDVGHLIPPEAGVYGDEDEAGGWHSEVAFEHGRRVGAEERDPLALPEPRVPQAGGQAVDALLQLSVGVASPAVDDGGLLGEHVGAAPEEADRRKLAAVDLLAQKILLFSLPDAVYRPRLRVCHDGKRPSVAKRLISGAVACEKKEKDEHPRETPFGAPRPPHRGIEALAKRLREPRKGVAVRRRRRRSARPPAGRFLAGDRHPCSAFGQHDGSRRMGWSSRGVGTLAWRRGVRGGLRGRAREGGRLEPFPSDLPRAARGAGRGGGRDQ